MAPMTWARATIEWGAAAFWASAVATKVADPCAFLAATAGLRPVAAPPLAIAMVVVAMEGAASWALCRGHARAGLAAGAVLLVVATAPFLGAGETATPELTCRCYPMAPSGAREHVIANGALLALHLAALGAYLLRGARAARSPSTGSN